MELYTATSYELAERLTKRYSTSFSLSSLLFEASIRRHIYAIYSLVRIADEIVDTYDGDDQKSRLDELQAEVATALSTKYSVNPIVHAYADTALRFGITDTLTGPFFESMYIDVTKKTFTQKQYEDYIYGSAEVIGLMCLRVFVDGDDARYQTLLPGARALGAAYQKVNFLRDMKADHDTLGRVYFPGVSYETFSEDNKRAIIADIEDDFLVAKKAIEQLPEAARPAVKASYYYYNALLQELKLLPADTILSRRVRVANWRKIVLLMKARFGV